MSQNARARLLSLLPWSVLLLSGCIQYGDRPELDYYDPLPQTEAAQRKHQEAVITYDVRERCDEINRCAVVESNFENLARAQCGQNWVKLWDEPGVGSTIVRRGHGSMLHQGVAAAEPIPQRRARIRCGG